jgi:outer membrane biogenesis lipoprotein LolB
MKVLVPALATLLLTACSNSGSGDSASASAEIPAECDRYFKVMSVCNANGEKSSPQEAEQMYSGFVQDWKDNPGDLTADQCRTTADALETAQRTGC